MFSVLAKTVNVRGNEFANISEKYVLANSSKSTVHVLNGRGRQLGRLGSEFFYEHIPVVILVW